MRHPRHWRPAARPAPRPRPSPPAPLARPAALARAAGGLLLAAALLPAAAPAGAGGARAGEPPATLHVSPGGSDGNDGTSAAAPLATIQKAVDLAPTGGTVVLAPGTYDQDIETRRAGLTLTGPETAVVRGSGRADRVVQVRHDRVTLRGFTVDGLAGDPGKRRSYRDMGIYVMSAIRGDGVDRFRALGLTVRNFGGECVRLRYLVTRSEIGGSRIGPCGAHDFRFRGGGRNGEGVYIGTAPEQLGDGAPDDRRDTSSDNHVHHNDIDTRGNECVEIKEHATGNLVEHNRCTGGRDPNAGGLVARGDDNVFRFNDSHGNAGAGIRFGGDRQGDGTGNSAYGNTVHGNRGGGIRFQRQPQGLVCGNRMWDNRRGDAVGRYASRYQPAAACG